MYIDIVPNRNSPPAVLLREAYREGGKVKKRTLCNLSSLPMDKVELIRKVLRGERLAPVDELFQVVGTRHHGHAQAVRAAMRRLGLGELVASRPSRERDLVLAMVAARVLEPESKLATTRWWRTTTLAADLGVEDATEDDLYAAMDWLLARQGRIERKLAARHLSEGGLALWDLTSTYVEGTSCPLAARGYSRDGRRGSLQVNWGLLTDQRGCPVAVSAYPGDTSDAETFVPELRKMREEFGLGRVVVVGDRGMIGQKQIDQLQGRADLPEVGWITALKASQVRKLVADGTVQPSLWDERNLMEIPHPDHPGERLIVCRNPLQGEHRARVRAELVAATARELTKVAGMVARGKLAGKAAIGVRVGRVVNKYKVAKHFDLLIEDDAFSFRVNEERVRAEAALDGLYVIRTNVPSKELSAADTVRSYKLLTQVEQAFRSLKTMDLKVRPIFHHLEDRVRAHLFLCMLSYYVTWHMREAWRELLWSDEEPESRWTRDPVAPARRSRHALAKVQRKTVRDGSEVHSFRTLFCELATIVRDTCRRRGAAADEPTFTMTTVPNPKQRRALALLEQITPYPGS